MSIVWQFDPSSVSDGDTIRASLSRMLDEDGDRQLWEIRKRDRIRLIIVDTPERGEEGWSRARQDTIAWLSQFSPGDLCVETYGRDDFGRLLGDVYPEVNRGDTLTQHLLRVCGWMPWVPS